ncbi:MAG: GatB/YqeY domain-containing protein [Rhodobacteraceae bacterium]|nr:GatB/YqeY domain-containing protein [Paracoccaceae bacterium]
MRTEISEAMKTAMREKDQTRLGTLRLMNAAIKDRDIAIRSASGEQQLADEIEILQLLGKMMKQREESAKAYEEAGRLELADRERAEIRVIQEFLPQPLSVDETQAAVRDAIAETAAASVRDIGKVMGVLKQRYAGRLDFGAVGPLVRTALTG